ncbi:IclR family transcriptional regulator [Nesterenkonia ebinurensis]|uniref:IclR family transcriptional regulator n=1 Tax=Nesterenkonia ebinurensis TaxID=2608252 RepID=UPI001CC5A563|nr:IclR family transcriptional regulator [Nesterenkonia ebinurensis]
MVNSRTYRRPPAYPIEAVDNVLVLLEMLRDFGAVHISEAAQELAVSPSTVHRLMAMLVYRGFAEQDASRRYVPGPALGTEPVGVPWTAELRRRAQPHLDKLAEEVDEAVNLLVRVGTEVRFLTTVEGMRPLGVGDRRGAVMPARQASAGKAILAAMPDPQVEALYRCEAENRGVEYNPEQHQELISELAMVRRQGFAANFEGTEQGVSALGVALRDGSSTVVGGLTVAMPRARFGPVFESGLVPRVFRAKAQLEADLADFESGAL